MNYFQKSILFVLFFYAFEACCQNQADSVVHLSEVIVESSRFHTFSSGNKIQKIDSATIQNYQSSSLGELLSQQSNIYFKTYGPGNLSTISLRGTGAQHTAVLWNGFNIQNPGLGQSDFSLLPISLAENIEVQYGGSGALFGSGAVGGIIQLNNPLRFNKGLGVSFTSGYGSYNNYFQSVNFKTSKLNYVSSIKGYYSRGENNFPYRNSHLEGNPQVKQSNAAFSQAGLLFENNFRINEKQETNVRLWIQDSNRRIPPSMFEYASVASIHFKQIRMTSEWKRTGDKTTYFARTGFFIDEMNYRDPSKSIDSYSKIQSSISEIEANLKLNQRSLLNIGLNNTYNTAISSGYNGSPSQNRTAIFASCKIQNIKRTINGNVSIREEYVGGTFIPVMPSAGAEYDFLKIIKLKGNVSRNFRLPTFNDLYWTNAGNPNLKPESGWSQELGCILQPKFKFLTTTRFEATVFNSHINNMIIWTPESSVVWTPKNAKKVWARGIELNTKLGKRINQFQIELSGMYSYILSTNNSKDDEAYGKQIIYVPIYSAQGMLSLTYKNYFITIIDAFTGNRFTDKDNSEYIKGYNLANILLGRNIKFKYSITSIQARINNLLNTSYQAVLTQAMPGRNYQISITFNFNKPNTHN